MSNTVIKVENLSKLYRLGEVGTGTLSHDLNRFWAKVRGKEDPFAKVGHINDRTQKAEKDEHVWALKDINFEVKQGEVLGIIGKNGAGKSTLLKLLSRVTSPTSGTMKMKGRVASLLEVGTGFHPELTGRENIFMNGTIMGMNRHEIRAKLNDIVDFAGVAKYLDTPVKRYSSGMTVRLGFAVAAFLEPEILIVDEVLAVGDAEFQKRAIGKMQEVSKGDGRTVLFVSHNMASIDSLCTKSLIIKDGQLLKTGNTSEIIELYLQQNSENLEIDLVNRTDRKGQGQVVFTKIELLNSEKELISAPITGRETILRLHYQSKSGENHKKCRISVAFKRQNRAFIVLSSELISEQGITLKNAGYVDYIIEKLPLSKGAYDLTLFLESNGEIMDWVDSAHQVNVEDGDFYGNGKNYPIGWAGKTVLVEHKLEVQ